MDHKIITAERGRRAEDLRAAAIAALEQQSIASGMLLDLDDDTCVAAGPKAAILMLLNGDITPAATSGDAPTDLLFRAKVADLMHLLPWDINFSDNERATGEQVLDEVKRMLRNPAVRIERAAEKKNPADAESAEGGAVLGSSVAQGIERGAAPAGMEFDEADRIADALYNRGYRDGRKERDQDARGCDEWQVVFDALTNRAASGATASGDELPVAWMRERDKNSVTTAEKERMAACTYGLWAEIAKEYTIPLYVRAAVSAATKPTADLSALAASSPEEVAAFEAWAQDRGYDMTTHSLHWLFLNERTNAARQGWKNALEFARSLLATKPAAPAVPVDAVIEAREQALTRNECDLALRWLDVTRLYAFVDPEDDVLADKLNKIRAGAEGAAE